MFRARPSLPMATLLAVGGLAMVAFRPAGLTNRTMTAATSKKDLILQRTLTNYVANPTVFRDFYSGITPANSSYTVNVATGDVTCPKSQVTITPLTESWKVAHKPDFRDGNGTAPNGYILARIDALTCDFTRIGLKKGRRAYWVVNLDDNLIMTSHFIDVGLSNATSASTAESQELLPNQRWGYSECPQSHSFTDDAAAVQPRVNVCWAHDGEAAFRSGPGGRLKITRKTFTSKAGQVHLFTDINDPPSDQFVWIVCADGCCYADT